MSRAERATRAVAERVKAGPREPVEPFPEGHGAYVILGEAWRRRCEAGRVTPEGELLPAETTDGRD